MFLVLHTEVLIVYKKAATHNQVTHLVTSAKHFQPFNKSYYYSGIWYAELNDKHKYNTANGDVLGDRVGFNILLVSKDTFFNSS